MDNNSNYYAEALPTTRYMVSSGSDAWRFFDTFEEAVEFAANTGKAVVRSVEMVVTGGWVACPNGRYEKLVSIPWAWGSPER